MKTDSPEILLVEDNPHDAELVTLALAKAGWDHKVKWVKNGAEALDFLKGRNAYEDRKNATPVRFVFLDLKLPMVNGFEVLERVRGDKMLESVPIVILTSSAVKDDIELAYALGANSYLVKPIDFKAHRKIVMDAANYWMSLNQTLHQSTS